LHRFAAKNSQTVENDREAISHSAQQSQSFPASPTNKTALLHPMIATDCKSGVGLFVRAKINAASI
jgi:hypothetical protein